MKPIGSQTLTGYLHEMKYRLAELEKFASKYPDLPIVMISVEFLVLQCSGIQRNLLREKFGAEGWQQSGCQFSKQVGEVMVQFHWQDSPKSAEVVI